ncbi:T-complex protein 1 subunit delta-like [Gossypium australe]|uniref:T-complex protein 1 subunit delta-like n=1 Tax=Gossypium australe TaxID=47621 RepID=A0A5B6VZH3_9ROSI|nr:T-complex protein 1 subunit delta-like [Gossypium australe]
MEGLVEPKKKFLEAVEKNDGVEESKKEHKPVKDRINKQYDAKVYKISKRVVNNKRKLDDLSTVELNEDCSFIIQNKLPTKLKDLGSFTIHV